MLRPAFGSLLFLSAWLPGSAGAQENDSCGTPSAIPSTHTAIPYPAISQRMGESGPTHLAATIGADGVLTDIAVSKSSGSRRLDDAAASHIRARYRWEPLAGKCNSATTAITIIVNWLLDPPSDVIALTMTEADYPPGALERGEQGRVVLTFSVDFEGVVTDVLRVTGSSGYPELDAKTMAILKNRIGEKLFRPWPALPIPSRTEPVSVLWKLPASAIASLKRKNIEIVEVRAPSIILRVFDGPTPAARP